jgi:hypothetical protein
MASVESSRVSKKYAVVSLRSFTPGTSNDTSGNETLYGLNAGSFSPWVSGGADTYAVPAYAPFDEIADALSYADELNNNRIIPGSGSPTYNSPTGGPNVPTGHETTDGLTYFWGVMEVWVIDPAVDPS